MLPRVQKSVREWTFTLASELPFWELESQWTPEFSEGNWRGQNSLDWRVIYIIEKILERRFLKWACMTHLDTWNTSYSQKKGRESNCQFDSGPLKVKNRPDLLMCRWCATYHWKDLNDCYNFALDLISIRGLNTKLWAPKVAGVPILGISGLPFGVLGQNAIWMLNLWPGTKYTIKGKVLASPKSGPWWVLWVRICPWLILTQKCSSYAVTNLLFSLCRFVWTIDYLSFFLVSSRSSNTPLYPKVLRTRERAPTPYSSAVFTSDSYLSLSRNLGVRQYLTSLTFSKEKEHIHLL
jgi:hypothetical protein